MLKQTLFEIPSYQVPVLNFKTKKKQLTNLLKSYPEHREGIQTFLTNRQTNRDGLAQGFTDLLKEEFNPNYVAGHSLGEFSALVASGYIKFADGLNLVQSRANAMQKSCKENP